MSITYLKLSIKPLFKLLILRFFEFFLSWVCLVGWLVCVFFHLTSFCMFWFSCTNFCTAWATIVGHLGTWKKAAFQEPSWINWQKMDLEKFHLPKKVTTITIFLWKNAPQHKPFHWADTGLWTLILQSYVFIDGMYKKGFRGIMKKVKSIQKEILYFFFSYKKNALCFLAYTGFSFSRYAINNNTV